MKDGISQVIVNLEAQKDEPTGYHILNRIVLNGIANKLPEHDEKYELHRLLSTLFSMELTVDEKLGIIEKEYSIVVDDRIREDVSAMCNLSQGIREKGRAEGEEKLSCSSKAVDLFLLEKTIRCF